MRVFVLLLLFANIVYMLWNIGSMRGEEGSNVSDSIFRDMEASRLVLLSEVVDEEAGSQIASEVNEEESPSIGEVNEAGIPEAEQELSETAQIEQVAEVSGEGQTPVLSTGLSMASSMTCIMLGPFQMQDEAEGVADQLTFAGYFADVERQEFPTDPDYWVHIPPFDSFAAAQEVYAELQEKGIDSYIISSGEGELALGISLGLFGEQERALSLQGTIAEQGYESMIYEVPRSIEEFHIKISGQINLPEAGPAPVEEIIAQYGQNLEEKICETIAPEL